MRWSNSFLPNTIDLMHFSPTAICNIDMRLLVAKLQLDS